MNKFKYHFIGVAMMSLFGCNHVANVQAPQPESSASPDSIGNDGSSGQPSPPMSPEPSAPPESTDDGSGEPSLNQISFVKPQLPCLSEPVLVVMPGVERAGTSEIYIENRTENPGKVPPLFGEYIQIGSVDLRTDERLSFVFAFEEVMKDISSDRELNILKEKTYYVVVKNPVSSFISMGPIRIKANCENDIE